MLIEDQKIFVSGRIWHELKDKVDVAPFIIELNEKIDLAKYGNGLSKYFFTFIILRPDRPIDWTGTYFSKKRKEAEIAVEIPYEEYLNSSEEDSFKLMQTAYLEGIDLIKTLPLKDGFDINAFKKDIRSIFNQPHWYKKHLEVT